MLWEIDDSDSDVVCPLSMRPNHRLVDPLTCGFYWFGVVFGAVMYSNYGLLVPFSTFALGFIFSAVIVGRKLNDVKQMSSPDLTHVRRRPSLQGDNPNAGANNSWRCLVLNLVRH